MYVATLPGSYVLLYNASAAVVTVVPIAYYAVDAAITQICRNVLVHRKPMIAKQADDRRASDGRWTNSDGQWKPVQPDDRLASAARGTDSTTAALLARLPRGGSPPELVLRFKHARVHEAV